MAPHRGSAATGHRRKAAAGDQSGAAAIDPPPLSVHRPPASPAGGTGAAASPGTARRPRAPRHPYLDQWNRGGLEEHRLAATPPHSPGRDQFPNSSPTGFRSSTRSHTALTA